MPWRIAIVGMPLISDCLDCDTSGNVLGFALGAAVQLWYIYAVWQLDTLCL